MTSTRLSPMIKITILGMKPLRSLRPNVHSGAKKDKMFLWPLFKRSKQLVLFLTALGWPKTNGEGVFMVRQRLSRLDESRLKFNFHLRCGGRGRLLGHKHWRSWSGSRQLRIIKYVALRHVVMHCYFAQSASVQK